MKIVETSQCGVSMCFIAVGWTAAASAGQDPLSLPGSCLAGRCRRSLSYGYGRLRLSDAEEAGEKGGLFWGLFLVVGRSSLDFSIIMSNFAPCFLKERYA